MKLGPFFTPNTNTNSQWIKDLKVRAKTKKLLDENIGLIHFFLGPNLYNLKFGNGFLDITPKA